MSSNGTEQSFIGKCEVMFCFNPAEKTVYSTAYEREIVVCDECYLERTGRSEVDESSKRREFSELVERYVDTGTDRSEGSW